MKVAVIGAGVSGMVAAWRAQQSGCDVTVYESASRVGGHTDTHELLINGESVTVDSGFIVLNRDHYPFFTRILDTLNIATQPSDMSFSVADDVNGLQYGLGETCPISRQWHLWAKPRFWRMLKDLVRFYKEAPISLAAEQDTEIGTYLAQNHYSDAFTESHLLPMVEALWSAGPQKSQKASLKHIVRFFANHDMFNLGKRSAWETVVGGSHQYMRVLEQQLAGSIALNTPVQLLTRDAGGVTIHTPSDQQSYDACILACHSDQALKLLDSPSADERAVLGLIQYQPNQVLVHTDVSVMPKRRSAWASWNVIRDGHNPRLCQVSYWMNRLQNLSCKTPVFVSLNMEHRIDPDTVLARRQYDHPVFNADAFAAQQKLAQIQGKQHTWYCGAYWGSGFHEDGARSAEQAVASMLAHHEVQHVA